MTEERFSGLSLPERTKWVYFNGEFITSIRYYVYKINLYMIEGFYVELFYHHTQDRIEKIELLEAQSTRMKFYTDQIKLPAGLKAS